jgi:hypothetical protein
MFNEGGKIVILVRGKKSACRAGGITVACLIIKCKISARVQKPTDVHEYQRSKTQKIASFWTLNPQLQAPRHYFDAGLLGCNSVTDSDTLSPKLWYLSISQTALQPRRKTSTSLPP